MCGIAVRTYRLADVDSPVKAPTKARKAKRVIESDDDEDEQPVMKSPSKKENAGGKSTCS